MHPRPARRRRPLLGRAVAALAVAAALLAACGGPASGEQRASRSASHASIAAPAAIATPLHVRDDFDHGDAPTKAGWHAVGSGQSTWKVTPRGVLRGPATGKPGALLIGTGGSWSDAAISAKVHPVDGAVAGLLVRADDNARNGYRVRWNVTQRRIVLERLDDGSPDELDARDIAVPARPWSTVELRAVGTRLTVSVDGTPLLDARDDRYPTGLVGLASLGSAAAVIDDVHVQARVDDFTLAVLPDTQFYVPHRPAGSNTFTSQTRWLAAHRASRNIAFVLHEGDVINEICSAPQWKVASFAMARLDGKLPYAIAPGNKDIINYDEPCAGEHGYDVGADALAWDPFNHAAPGAVNFPPSRQRAASPQTWGGTMRPGDAASSYHRFEAGGVKFLVITLPFGPDAAMLRWAGDVARHNADRVGILVTHDYLGDDGGLRGDPNNRYDLPNLPGELDGEQIWEQLVSTAPNIRFVFNGHVTECQSSADTCLRQGIQGTRVRTNTHGLPVYQMLANYQSMPEGGQGYLRLLRFRPARHTVDVETWSPTKQRALTDASNRFTFRGVKLEGTKPGR